jgi:hypothetical protein
VLRVQMMAMAMAMAMALEGGKLCCVIVRQAAIFY